MYKGSDQGSALERSVTGKCIRRVIAAERNIFFMHDLKLELELECPKVF